MDPAAIKRKAAGLGFDLCGVAPAASHPELPFYKEWLARGYAGEMTYLARTADRRADVREVLPSAQSVICLGTIYNTAQPYSTEVAEPGAAHIARYAWGDDYHDVIGRRMDALLAWMRQQAAAEGTEFEARPYVDTGPVQERVYAQRAGIGWIGRNTCVINPDVGSWIFLSEIICSLPLQPDAPALDQCGTCTLCLEACPTEALVAPYVLDATRCLSYLTIELKGAVPEALRAEVGGHAYGCDICQEVCPWNLRAAVSNDPAWLPRPMWTQKTIAELWRTSDEDLRAALRGSAMSRARIRRLRRNLAVAAGATADPEAIAALEEVREPTCDEPLVAEHVEWAKKVTHAPS